jgi:hypothetical protein
VTVLLLAFLPFSLVFLFVAGFQLLLAFSALLLSLPLLVSQLILIPSGKLRCE